MPHFTSLFLHRFRTWSLHDRSSGSKYCARFSGYAGIMVAVSTLKKIERSTAAVEDGLVAVQATANAAQPPQRPLRSSAAALLHAHVIVNAERPWVWYGEPTRGVDNSFDITATNRGRSPATITSSWTVCLQPMRHIFLECLSSARLNRRPLVPIILLPAKRHAEDFSREDARGFCSRTRNCAR